MALPAEALLDDLRWYGAKTTLDDGRRLTFGFVFDRIAPRDATPHDGSPWTWGGVMGFPRELVKGPDGAPALRPVEELDALRVAAVSSTPDLEGSRGHWQIGAGGSDAAIVGEARPGREELAVLRMGRHPQQLEVGFQVTWGPHGSLGLVLQADAWWGLTTRDAVRVRDLECWRLERPEAGRASWVQRRKWQGAWAGSSGFGGAGERCRGEGAAVAGGDSSGFTPRPGRLAEGL